MHRLRYLLLRPQRAPFGRWCEQLLLARAAEDKNDPAGARTRAEKRCTNRGALPTPCRMST
jgi:hypothetical protein